MSNIDNLTESLKSSVAKFMDGCIPLANEQNDIYFMTKSKQVFCLDRDVNLFEPNSSIQKSVLSKGLDLYFTENVKNELTEQEQVNFNELTELVVKQNNQSKHLGLRYYYCESTNKIYSWSIFTKKWSTHIKEDLDMLFSNAYVMEKQEVVQNVSTTKSLLITTDMLLATFGITVNNLEEMPVRFRDGSIHYYHRKSGVVYTKSLFSNSWRVLPLDQQKQVLGYTMLKCPHFFEETVSVVENVIPPVKINEVNIPTPTEVNNETPNEVQIEDSTEVDSHSPNEFETDSPSEVTGDFPVEVNDTVDHNDSDDIIT
jgi:hypothetical protein